MSCTACHWPTTAAARVFCPWSSAPSAPNRTPPPLMLSLTGTSTFSAAARIESGVIAPEIFGSTSCSSVHAPTKPATAGMLIAAWLYRSYELSAADRLAVDVIDVHDHHARR